jgi:hypothetical protein
LFTISIFHCSVLCNHQQAGTPGVAGTRRDTARKPHAPPSLLRSVTLTTVTFCEVGLSLRASSSFLLLFLHFIEKKSMKNATQLQNRLVDFRL